MKKMSTREIGDLIAQAPNRRSFVKKLGIASAVLGAAAGSKGISQTTTISDADILNFALNLEYLEAEFYTFATTGNSISQAGLSVTGSGTSGPTTGGAQVTFTNKMTQAVAQELANDEQIHVKLIQTTLTGMGAQAIAKPAINLNALGFGFANQNDFLKLARIFEDIGVTAYGGAAPLIQSKTILGYAARILATEADHSGNIRFQIAMNAIATTPLDGADHVPPPSGSQYFPTDSNALTEVRTPGQVLYLAFGGAPNAMSGGFFPSGVNGILNTSSGAAATTDGPYISASPNPIIISSGTVGTTMLTWSAPNASVVQIRIGSPSGDLFAESGPSGSMNTGAWVTQGTTFYLQDVSNGKALTAANTIAMVTVQVQGSSSTSSGQ
jgi:hypothetical protein